MRGSKKPSVEELLPLRLVGDFCSWQVEVPGLELQSNGSLMGGKVLEFILLLQLEELVKFQIISSPLGFRARIYPKEDAALVKDAGQMGASEANGLVGGSGDGHGRNFIISDLKVKALLVRLALGKRGMEGPPLAAQVCFTLEPTRSGPTVAIGAGKVSLVGQTHVAWSDDPEQLRLQQLLPLRLVGHPCGWRLEQSGLVLTATHHEGPWQGHSLCMRLLTREVEFQIVSDKFGFAWRVFPGGTAKLPQCDGPSAALPAQQGGKDDGFGRNFLITGRPLSVITLLVWLNVEDEQVKGIRLAQGPTASSSKPSVAVGARRVQYPVLSQLTPLGPELLEAAETEDEKQISDFAPRGTDWGAMHPESRAPIPRRAYPEGPVLKAAASSPVVPAREAPKKADEVEAERLWWSDYCEQKLQELQESFSKELRRLTERMQADLRFTEDRLAAQVESEKDARQASVGDLRRESDHQSVEMSEIVRSQVDLREQVAALKQQGLALEQTLPSKSPSRSEELAGARDLESLSEKSPATNKMQIIEASLADLRREVQTCQEQSSNQSSETEQLLNSLKREVVEVQEKLLLQSRASEEQRSLHQVISQSAGDLGRGIEELSAALMHSEQQWRAETGKLEQQLRAELEELQRNQRQWTQGLHDERDSRGRELEIFKSLMEAANHRLDQVERDTSAQDVQKLLGRVEETQNDLTQLQAEQRLLQAECRRAPRAPAREEGQETAPEGSWRLRVEALESMIEAQVPKSLQLESQALRVALHQNANGFLVIPGPSLEGVPTMHADVSSVGRLWEVFMANPMLPMQPGQPQPPMSALPMQGLQEEYAAEDVQWEVLALRQLYPYQQKKSILALEMEGHTHLEEEPEEEGVQSYVRAAQELKKREKQAEEVEGKPGEGAEDTEATPGRSPSSQGLFRRCQKGQLRRKLQRRSCVDIA
ncbi:Hypothetical protein (Fragment) [Durusdinium trenchii]|uniref:Uncharacterized protein n=1 Tax=Durusdinium trenchii TaxID=1381693 RepID=A0ABP0MM17_9DINO